VVVDYALRLKRECPGTDLIVAGYSNDVMCYVPSRRVLREGGYEADQSMIYYGQPGPFAENVEQTLVRACRRLLAETAAGATGKGARSRPTGSAGALCGGNSLVRRSVD
jgi:hypothetical protein